MNIEITEGVVNERGIKVIEYGPEGIGKTTLATQYPNPLFIDTEGSTSNYNVRRLPKPNTLDEFKEIVGWVLMHPDQLRTLVIDTADWLEHMFVNDFCIKNGIKTLGDMSYGKGYEASAKSFLNEVLKLLDAVTDRGIHVVLNCHHQVKTISLPDDLGSYDRYELKMEKKHTALIKEWADLIVFMNFKNKLVYQNKDDKKAKAVGGQERIMYFTRTASFDAKNRFGLPDSAPLDYNVIRHIFEPNAVPQGVTDKVDFTPTNGDMTDFTTEEYQGIIPDLMDLLVLNNYPASVIEEACVAATFAPKGVKLKDYPQQVQENLVQIFPQVKEFIASNGFDLPF